MARRSTIGSTSASFFENDKFSTIPLARRKEIQDEVQHGYVEQLNTIKARVDKLTSEQREQFHQTLARLLAETSFKRVPDERK
ncbi:MULTISPECIES: hypothetical protein [Yersinia]|uniref:hypothetical protein n=1 Tax=Yersinia TaxID=629 RepID=UPI000BFC78FF|nr:MULTISPECIES: hypothetical protein [Yersinia]ATM87634.1 hypothetical protein CRN74_17030 [Yersinia frederiksenii]MCB5319287.1 hypothetical protein [Yersinia massiliensis]HEI6967306.1 hypothetical protein [Yersinia enterocolitica]